MAKVKCANCGEVNKPNLKYCSSCGSELPRVNSERIVDSIRLGSIIRIRKRTALIGAVVVVIAFTLSYFAVQRIFFKPPTFDTLMMQAASELNKTCPITLDEYTRLDNAVALPDHSFQYNYTLTTLDRLEVNVDSIRKYVEPGLIENVRTNPDLKIYRDNKTTMIYNYRDKHGEFVVKFSVTPDMYQ